MLELQQEVITVVEDAFFSGFQKLHSYDPLKHKLVLHYVVHVRVGLSQHSNMFDSCIHMKI